MSFLYNLAKIKTMSLPVIFKMLQKTTISLFALAITYNQALTTHNTTLRNNIVWLGRESSGLSWLNLECLIQKLNTQPQCCNKTIEEVVSLISQNKPIYIHASLQKSKVEQLNKALAKSIQQTNNKKEKNKLHAIQVALNSAQHNTATSHTKTLTPGVFDATYFDNYIINKHPSFYKLSNSEQRKIIEKYLHIVSKILKKVNSSARVFDQTMKALFNSPPQNN